jgi:hypothetical protein
MAAVYFVSSLISDVCDSLHYRRARLLLRRHLRPSLANVSAIHPL